MARILIAEDEDAIRNLIARALRQDGHDVITAIDGAQALDVLAREKGTFELLLTDIRMPIMDGITLAHAAARCCHHRADDGLCRSARTGARPRCADPRRHHQAVLARGDAPRGQRRALRTAAAQALAAREERWLCPLSSAV